MILNQPWSTWRSVAGPFHRPSPACFRIIVASPAIRRTWVTMHPEHAGRWIGNELAIPVGWVVHFVNVSRVQDGSGRHAWFPVGATTVERCPIQADQGPDRKPDAGDRKRLGARGGEAAWALTWAVVKKSFGLKLRKNKGCGKNGEQVILSGSRNYGYMGTSQKKTAEVWSFRGGVGVRSASFGGVLRKRFEPRDNPQAHDLFNI